MVRGLQRTARKRVKRAKLKAKKAADHLAKKSKQAGEQHEEKVGEELGESDEEGETVADDAEEAEEASFVMMIHSDWWSESWRIQLKIYIETSRRKHKAPKDHFEVLLASSGELWAGHFHEATCWWKVLLDVYLFILE